MVEIDSFIEKRGEKTENQTFSVAISGLDQMLLLNCSAAVGAVVGIFTTMSLCMRLPQSVGDVDSRDCWPTSGSIVPFVYIQPGPGMHTCARLNGFTLWE